jgi:cytochrome c553
VMPTYQGQISEEGIAHLIAYIKDMKPPGQAAPAQPSGH